MTFLKQIWREEEGQDLIEYTLLLGIIALFAGGVAYTGISGQITGIWTEAGTVLAGVTP